MVKIEYYGHSFFIIESRGGTRIAVDPFITGNPRCPIGVEDVKVDIVAVTHGHGDHLGDAIPIAKANDATLVAIYEITQHAARNGVKKVEGMNFGGTISIGDVRITMVPAMHSSGISEVDFGFDGGAPGGFIFHVDGTNIYHAGDTSIFSGMELIHSLYKPDVAMIPVGDRFTMGPHEASQALKLLKPGIVIPMHWGTFPIIEQTPDRFVSMAEEVIKSTGLDTEIRVMHPGDSLEL